MSMKYVDLGPNVARYDSGDQAVVRPANTSVPAITPASTMHVTDNSKTVNDDYSVTQVAAESIRVLRDIISEEVEKVVPQIRLCEVAAKVDEDHYDLYLIPDRNRLIRNIVNNTKFDLRVGDYVELMDNQNNPSTGFIIGRRIAPPTQQTLRYNAGFGTRSGSTSNCYLRYTGERWWLIFSDAFYQEFIVPELRTVGEEQEARLIVGVSRVLSQKSGSGRARWAHWWNDGSHNSQYSLPRTIGRVSNLGTTDHIITSKIYTIKALDCIDTPVPAIDVTHIVNNSIFEDDYLYRRSKKRVISTPTEKIPYLDFIVNRDGSWFKRFGIFIKSVKGDKLYVTPSSEAYTVRIHGVHSSREYNVNNLYWMGGTSIVLKGEPTTPFEVDPDYIIPEHTMGYFLTSDSQYLVTSWPEARKFKVVSGEGSVLTTVDDETLVSRSDEILMVS